MAPFSPVDRLPDDHHHLSCPDQLQAQGHLMPLNPGARLLRVETGVTDRNGLDDGPTCGVAGDLLLTCTPPLDVVRSTQPGTYVCTRKLGTQV